MNTCRLLNKTYNNIILFFVCMWSVNTFSFFLFRYTYKDLWGGFQFNLWPLVEGLLTWLRKWKQVSAAGVGVIKAF